MAQWSKDPNSPGFQPLLVGLGFYATKMYATNDPAERALKTLKDNITRFHNEENLQGYLVTIVEEKKLAKARVSLTDSIRWQTPYTIHLTGYTTHHTPYTRYQKPPATGCSAKVAPPKFF